MKRHPYTAPAITDLCLLSAASCPLASSGGSGGMGVLPDYGTEQLSNSREAPTATHEEGHAEPNW